MIKPSRLFTGSSTFICALMVWTVLFTITAQAAPYRTTHEASSSQALSLAKDAFTLPSRPDNVNETIIPEGDVSGTWTAENSPYTVTGTITIPDLESLTIEPGVEVYFDGNYQMIVLGRLTAIGTEDNRILFTAVDSLVQWGGMRLDGAATDTRIEYCDFSYGYAQGEWPDNTGGAMRIDGSIQSVKRCTFLHNRAEFWGGAVYIWGGGANDFSYNVFSDNIAQKQSQRYGHAIYVGSSESLILNHLTITGNGPQGGSSDTSGYALYGADGDFIQISNSIIWDSYAFTWEAGDVNYCDLQDADADTMQLMGVGNIAADPRFEDAEALNFTLRANSPCIDGASPNSPYSNEPAPNGSRANMGADGNSANATQSIPIFSFDSESRVLDYDPIDFGLVKVDIEGDTSITIYNVGRQPLQFMAVDFDDQQFFSNFDELADSVTHIISVGPDSSLNLTLSFMPGTVDFANGTLSFTDNDTSNNEVSIDLSGTGVNPIIDATPTHFTFENLQVGDTLTQSITVSNIGENVGQIESLLIPSRFYGTDNFSIVTIYNDEYSYYPRDTIEVGESVDYTVLFHPSLQGSFNDTIEIASNAGSFFVTAEGSGSQPILRWDPHSLEYGVVALNEESTLNFQVWNPGSVNLELSNFEFSIEGSFTYEASDTVVVPGDTITVSVTFSPTVTGTYEGTLTIDTNISDEDQVIVLLYGTGTSQTNYWIGSVGDVTWEEALEPYYVVGDITIPAGQTLTIEPGVRVRFEGDFTINVDGNLQAVGDAGNRIEFTTINVTDSTWSGIYFREGSDDSRLKYCDLHRGAYNDDEDLEFGGVLRVKKSSPTISRCNFYDNTSDRGGAIGLLGWAEAQILNCEFYDNSATTWGGAIYCGLFSNSEIDGCDIHDNSAENGGGIYLAGSSGMVSNNEIYLNSAASTGGGLLIGDGTSASFEGNLIYTNSADNGGGVAIVWFSKPFLLNEIIYANSATTSGGGLFVQDGSTPLIQKCLIAENVAATGHALYTVASGSLINNCTLVGTSSDVAGWAVYAGSGDQSMISNSIIGELGWPGVDENALEAAESELMITYSDVLSAGGAVQEGLNNINVDPQFLNQGTSVSEIYSLGEGSPVMTHAEDGGMIGFEGGSETITWNTELAVLQNPILESSLAFVFTSTVPLLTAPYMYMTQDLPDTMAYIGVDSSYMQEISPMVYMLPLYQEYPGRPTRVYFSYANIFGSEDVDTLSFVANTLSSLEGLLNLPGGPTVTGTGENGTGTWGIMPIEVTIEQALDPELVAIGQAYNLFAAGVDLRSGTIEIPLDGGDLGDLAAEHCAIACWSGDAWEVLPSYLSAGKSSLSTQIDRFGSYRLVWGEELHSTVALPSELTLYQNYPNPFNPETVIQFAMPQADRVKLEIFNLMGQKVISLIDGRADAGYHAVRWHGLNAQGMPAASGVYFYRLQAGQSIQTKKMILLR